MVQYTQENLRKSPLFGLKHLYQVRHFLSSAKYLPAPEQLDKYYKLSKTANREVYYPDYVLRTFHLELNKYLSQIEKPYFLKSGKKGESYLSHATSHLNQNQLLSLDIKSYYKNISRLDVFKFFKNELNCSHKIADYLACFCTYKNQLPLGSPLSMNLAYLINQQMLYQLLDIASRNNLTMTVYVDDILFSGENIPSKVKYEIIGVINKYGYSINKDKFRFYKNRKLPKETSGVVIQHNKLSPTKEKLAKLREELKLWNKVLREHKSFYEVHYRFIRVIGFVGYLCLVDDKFIQLKKQIVSEYRKAKEDDFLAKFGDSLNEWNTLLNNYETPYQDLNKKHLQLNLLIKNLSKLNKKHLSLYKKVKDAHERHKNLRNSTFRKTFRDFLKIFN